MPEAVIVATARSPIGRAMKGSLKDIRPDDLSAQVLTDLMSKVPAVTPDHIDDLLMGCGQPAGESGHNIGRATAVLGTHTHVATAKRIGMTGSFRFGMRQYEKAPHKIVAMRRTQAT